MRDFVVGTFVPYLRTLSHLLEKGADLPDVVEARLTADMYPLWRQVEIACHHARSAVLALTEGKPLPTPDGGEVDLAKLRALIAETVAFVESRPDAAYANSAERVIVYPLRPGHTLTLDGGRFLREWSFAHFFFHVVTAYDILRVHGVELGKRDFVNHVIGAVSAVSAESPPGGSTR